MTKSLYDIHKTYQENWEEGPFFTGEVPPRDASATIDFLGFPVNSRIGVPAGPLLNAKWVALAGKLGFDIPVYKTIRSKAYQGHPLPNVRILPGQGLTITNSFGMPSQGPEILKKDIAKANASLAHGQVMIVSIVGSNLQDFVATAQFAKTAGAKIIEANFSCPNVEKKEGILYLCPETVGEYTRKLVQAIHPVPLVLKVGVFPEEPLMRKVFLAAARGGARAICGINSVSQKIEPPLDANRTTSGVCGEAIFHDAVHFISLASRIIREEKIPLTLMGCGGIINPTQFDTFLDAGADIAMSATGMMWDPLLARKYHEAKAAC